MTKSEFGKNLARLRKRMQLTQENVAKRLKISRSNVALIESGKRPINTFQLEILREMFCLPGLMDFFVEPVKKNTYLFVCKNLGKTTNLKEEK